MMYHQPSTRVLINETAVNLNVANDSCELVDESGQMRMQNEVEESLNEFNWSRELSSSS
jgi:predicted proteasome-type protease